MVLNHLPSGAAKSFVYSLQLTAKSEFAKAISVLSDSICRFLPKPICVLNQICINALQAKQMDVFDDAAKQIPLDDMEIVDLRAARLKALRNSTDLSQLVLAALNADEGNANAWLAFSHLIELNNDHQRALQTTRKALLLDRHSRRGYMRHGELRMQRNDTKKALTAFNKAHHLQEGLDSFTAIVQCLCALQQWSDAEAYALRASSTYTQDGEQTAYSLNLLGLAIRNRDSGKAVQLFRKALQSSPSYTEPLSMLIEMRMKESDYDGAEAILREYRQEGEDFYFWLRLGEIYGMKRDFQKALEYMTRAVHLDPAHERAREMQEQLEQMIRDNSSEVVSEEDMME
jgi:tetratricopeptide (TPR) repeat protein